MFIRSEFKQRAKEHLHRNLWLCIGVTFFVSFIGGELFGIEVDPTTTQYYFRMGLGTIGNYSFDFIYIPITTALIVLVLAASLAFNFLIINPIKVGHARYYIENRHDKSSFESLFTFFNANDYWNVVKVMCLYDIYIALWTLCFIIPGIIKTYQYFAIPYILAENPNMDSLDVFDITKEMTDGHKFDLFVLDLSFILWLLLVTATFGIASFYVNPYIMATNTEAYFFFKEKLLASDIIQVDVVEETEHVEPTIDDLH